MEKKKKVQKFKLKKCILETNSKIWVCEFGKKKHTKTVLKHKKRHSKFLKWKIKDLFMAEVSEAFK